MTRKQAEKTIALLLRVTPRVISGMRPEAIAAFRDALRHLEDGRKAIRATGGLPKDSQCAFEARARNGALRLRAAQMVRRYL